MYRTVLEEPRPSVLAVTSHVPWPPDSGGRLRSYHLLRALASRFHVRLVAGNRTAVAEGKEILGRERMAVRAVPLRGTNAIVEGLRAVGQLLRIKPYVLYGRHDRREMRRALAEELENNPPSLLYLDHLDSASLVRQWPAIPVVIDMHNVYSLLVRREAQQRSGLTGLYLKREALLLKQVEQRISLKADAMFTVSEVEASYFRRLGASVEVVPNGVDCKAYELLRVGRVGRGFVILYVGSMGWTPNAEAARFLASVVLPRVRQQNPSAELYVVGRDPPADLVSMNGRNGVHVTGGVDSLVPFLEQASLLAVPLEVGGGTRLKILEAMAAGLPVVSTAVGCEGLDVVPGVHLLVCARDRFADAITTMLADPGIGVGLALQGRELVRRSYDWNTIGTVACDAIDRLVARRFEGRLAMQRG